MWLRSVTTYLANLPNLVESVVLVFGLTVLLYSLIAKEPVAAQTLPFLAIIGKNCWEYYAMIREEREMRRTRAQANEEVAFGNFDEPVQIEMEAVGTSKQ